MIKKLFYLAISLTLLLTPTFMVGQTAPTLGTASSFALFTAVGAFGNVGGGTTVTGDVGTNVGAFTGFPPGTLIGTSHVANPTSAQTATDVSTAYSYLSGVTCGPVLGVTLGGGQVLTPNVYCIGAAATLTGSLVLDGQGNPNSLFIIKINGALSAAASSSVVLINGASLCNVYWQINGQFALAANATFRGTALVNGAIDFSAGGAKLFGRALSISGAISLKNSTVTIGLQPTASTITTNGSTTFCAGGSVVLSGNTGGTWSNGGSNSTKTITTSGTYYVTNTSLCGSITSNSITVTVVPNPTIAVNSGTICAGNSITLTATGATTYSWSPGTGLNSTTGNSVIANPTLTTVYTVTGTTGGCSSTKTSTVTVKPLPTATIAASGPTTFCQGGSVTLTASSGSSYLWSTSATTQSIVVNTSGNYSVTVTGANGCSATSSVITVVVNPLPTVIVNNGVICSGSSATLTANGANTYSWSPGTALSATTGSNVIANPTVTTTYTITGTSAAGCVNTTNASVTVVPSLTLTINSASICIGNSATLTANGANSYSWSPGTGLNSTTGSSVIANPTVTTVYTVTGTAGACTATQTSTVTVNPLPTATIAAGGPLTFCQGDSVKLTASAGTTYSWSTGATTQSISVTTAGNYSVTVTNANGCSATSSVTTVVVNPLPTITVNSATICPGSSATLTASGANTYTWSPSAGLNTTTGASVIANPTVTTTYTITGTSVAGCVNTTTASVTVVPSLTLTVDSGTICSGNSITLTANGANTYSWSPGTGLNSTTGTSVIANPTITTVYTVTGTSGNCSATQTSTVTVNPLPTATIAVSGPIIFCEGGSVILTASSGTSYLWSNAATTQSIAVTTSGNYSVTVTGANGCSATSSAITVVVNPPPTATISASGPTTICQGDYVILTSSPGSSYLWSNSATTQSIIVSIAGNYSVTVTDANGCSATSSVTSVFVNFLPTASVAVNGPTVFCQGGSTTLTASGGVSYLWSNNATTQSITVTTGGNYSVTVTSINGCTVTSAAVTISVNPSPTVNLGADTTVCGCILLNAYNPGATYNWNTGQDYSMINVCVSGDYWVNVSNGICITTDTIHVTVHPKPVVNISMITGSVTILNAGNPGASFLWNTGATTQTIVANTLGVYFVTVTNQFGCIGSDTTNVGQVGISKNILTYTSLKIYPNPTFNKNFNLSFDAFDRSTVEIRIVNTLGIPVYEEKLENFYGQYNKNLDFQTFAKGMYYAEVRSGAKRSVIKISLE